MTGRTMHVSPKLKRTPKGFIVSPQHKVLWRSSQVEYSVRCFRAMKVGDRVGVCEHRGEEVVEIPKGPVKFWTGTVEKLWGRADDPLVTIKFDDAYSLDITFGVKQYAQFCIFLPDEKKKRSRRKANG